MLDLLIAANAKRIAKLPKAARAGLGAGLLYFGFVSIVNLAPGKVQYIPGVSNIIPVAAEVTKGGVTRTEIISHTEFTRINEEGARVQQFVTEFQEDVRDAISEIDAYLDTHQATLINSDGSYDIYNYTVESRKEGTYTIVNITWEDGDSEEIYLFRNNVFVGEYTHDYDGRVDQMEGTWEVDSFGQYTLDYGDANFVIHFPTID